MYAIVNHVDGHGTSVVHTRATQEAANAFAVEMAVEQTDDPNSPRTTEQLDAFKAEVLEAIKVHGVWIDGQQLTVTVIQVSTSHEGRLYEKPMTTAEMREAIKGKDNAYVTGVVLVDLSSVIDNDLEGFLDLISEKLCGSSLLMDVNYDVVGTVGKQGLLVEVTGDVSQVLENRDDDGEDDDDDDDGDDDPDDGVEPTGPNAKLFHAY